MNFLRLTRIDEDWRMVERADGHAADDAALNAHPEGTGSDEEDRTNVHRHTIDKEKA